jgi:hypothetical protein
MATAVARIFAAWGGRKSGSAAITDCVCRPLALPSILRQWTINRVLGKVKRIGDSAKSLFRNSTPTDGALVKHQIHEPLKRDSHSPNAPMLVDHYTAFQAWDQGHRIRVHKGRFASAAPLHPKGLPSRRDIYSWRATLQVGAAENCRMRIQNARMFFSGRQARLAHLQKWQITEQFTGSVFSTCGPAFPIFIG